MNVVTNGVLLNESTVLSLIKIKRLNQISISLNASNEEDYNLICNMPKETFKTLVNNIKHLVNMKRVFNSKVEIVVSAVCSNEFLPKVKDFLLFVDNLGVDRIDIHNYIDFSIVEDIDQWNAIGNKTGTKDILDDLSTFIKGTIETPVNLPLLIKENRFSKKCSWYFKSLSFDSFGNVGSCGRVMNPDKSYGNILSNKNIWNNQYMQEMREKFINKNADLPKCCKHCIENYTDNE